MKRLPDHYRPDHAGNWDYGPNPRETFEMARQYRKTSGIAPAAVDQFTVELVAVDMQKDFCLPEGSLYVGGRSGKGAIEDNDRIARLIYRNLPHITAITNPTRVSAPMATPRHDGAPPGWRSAGQMALLRLPGCRSA